MDDRRSFTLTDLAAAVRADPKLHAASIEVAAARSAARILRDARRASGLSQHELAGLLDVKQPRISQVESGKIESIPPLEFMARFLAACGQQLVLAATPIEVESRRAEDVGRKPQVFGAA